MIDLTPPAAAERRQMQRARRTMAQALLIATAALAATLTTLHDAPARVAATVWQAEQEIRQ
jgi:hypothetical protein